MIDMNCEEDEELGACIERLEKAGETPKEIIDELKAIVMRQSEAGSGAANGLLVLTALTATLLLSTF